MLGSSVLDVAIGLVFVFLLVSLIVTTANEFIAALLSSRARWLKKGLNRLLGAAWSTRLYEHPLVGGSFVDKQGPSYIAARTFSTVLIDLLRDGDTDVSLLKRKLHEALDTMDADVALQGFGENLMAAMKTMPSAGTAAQALAKQVIGYLAKSDPAAFQASDATRDLRAMLDSIGDLGALIATVADPNVRTALQALYEDAGRETAKFKENIELWFNNSMDRVGGWYKRRSQWVIACVALIVTLVLNVDTMLIVQHLNTQSGLREALVTQAKSFADTHAVAATAPNPATTSMPNSGTTTASNAAAASSASGGSAPAPGELIARADELAGTLTKLNLPIGWFRVDSKAADPLSKFRTDNRLVLESDSAGWAKTIEFHIVGWLLTALAASLGAPFWFDILNKFMAVRAAGKAPEEKPKSPKEVPVALEAGQSPREAESAAATRR